MNLIKWTSLFVACVCALVYENMGGAVWFCMACICSCIGMALQFAGAWYRNKRRLKVLQGSRKVQAMPILFGKEEQQRSKYSFCAFSKSETSGACCDESERVVIRNVL